MYMCHIFFIRVSGCRRCFCILAIVNATVNMVWQICFQVSVFIFLEKYPEVGLLL